MHELTNLELHFIVQELQRLVGTHLEQVYGAGDERFRLKFRGASGGEVIVDLKRKLIYFTKRVEKSEAEPDDFVSGLRRRLENAKVEAVEQHKFDRVVVFRLRSKEGTFNLIIEIFSNGNIVVCDDSLAIVQCLRREEWKDRKIAVHEKYIFPHSGPFEPGALGDAKLDAMMTEKHIIATLARAVPLGTIYLEEALAKADISPTEKGREVETKRLKALASAIKEIMTAKVFSVHHLERGPQFSCYPLSDYESAKRTEYKTLSECIDEALAAAPAEPAVDQKLLHEKEKLEHALREQKEALAGFEKEEAESREKADAIYASYQEVEEKLKEAREKGKHKIELEL